MVECRTPEREVRGSKPTAAVLCPWARHFTPRKYWLITQEAMAPSRHDWKIVDWDVKPQHNQPTNLNYPLRAQQRLWSDWASRLIWVFAGRTFHLVGFVMMQLIWRITNCSFVVLQIGKGVLRIMKGDSKATADIIPVDLATNMLIAVGWYTATQRSVYPIHYFTLLSQSTTKQTKWHAPSEDSSASASVLSD